jgi:hypothetical protein
MAKAPGNQELGNQERTRASTKRDQIRREYQDLLQKNG